MVGRGRRPLDRHTRTRTSGDLTAAATAPSSETMHTLSRDDTNISNVPPPPEAKRLGWSLVANPNLRVSIGQPTMTETVGVCAWRLRKLRFPPTWCFPLAYVYLASYIRSRSREGDRGREADQISAVDADPRPVAEPGHQRDIPYAVLPPRREKLSPGCSAGVQRGRSHTVSLYLSNRSFAAHITHIQ